MRKKLGEILVDGGLIDDFQLQASLGHQRQWGGRIGEIVESKGFTTAEAVADALAEQLGLERFVMGPNAVDLKAAKLIAADLADRQLLIPFKTDGDRGDVLWIAMNDPTDLATLDEIQFQTGKRIKVAAASEKEIRAIMAFVYEGTPLPPPAPPPPPVVVGEPEDLADADVLTEVEPLEEVDAMPVDPAAFVPTPAPGFAPPPVIGSAAAPVRAQPLDPSSLTPEAFAPATVEAKPLVPESNTDMDADLAALGFGDDAPAPAPVPASAAAAAEPAAAPNTEAEARADFDPEGAAAMIADALDKMAAGEALPEAVRRFVNPTQMAAALTRLLIRKGVIEEIELIDELQKK